MSRLDYFTIVIVVICVIALGFLVYKVVNLGKEQATPGTESTMAKEEAQKPGDYTYDDQGTALGDDTQEPGATDEDLDDDELTYDPQKEETKATTPSPAAESETAAPTPAKATPPASTTPKSPVTSTPPKSTTPATTTPKSPEVPASYEGAAAKKGDFLVVAGSFSQKANAESQVKRLKKLGYSQAGVEMFNNGTLAVAMVDRFSDYDAAKKLVAELKGKGVDAFVKKKE